MGVVVVVEIVVVVAGKEAAPVLGTIVLDNYKN